MSRKQIKFSGNQIILEGREGFSASDFSVIEELCTDRLVISDDVLGITKIQTSVHENRFVSIYFSDGDKYPYSETVVKGEDLEVVNNPRDPDMIEMNGQLFVVIDCVTKRLWISDQRQRNRVTNWLHDKTKFQIHVKSIIPEKDFISKMKSISTVYFTLLPNLFNSTENGSLSANLSNDIYGFGADSASVQFRYKSSKLTGTIRKKIENIISKKGDFEEITVIGRSDDGLETILNLDEIISKITIQVNQSETSKLVEPVEVFLALEGEIKKV